MPKKERRTSKLEHGDKFFAIIIGTPCVGHVSKNKDGNLYLCQNTCNGDPADDLLGYQYSWYISNGSDADLSESEVRDLRNITYPDWRLGDLVMTSDSEVVRGEVIFSQGQLVVLEIAETSEASSNFTPHELYEKGFILYSLEFINLESKKLSSTKEKEPITPKSTPPITITFGDGAKPITKKDFLI